MNTDRRGNPVRKESDRQLKKSTRIIKAGEDRKVGSQIVILVVSIVVVGILVSFVHWPALSAEASSFDDYQYLTANLLVQNPSLASARQFLVEVFSPSTVAGYYQPLTMISLMLDYAMGGRVENLKPFHLTSLCFHVANTALVIVLLYLLFDQPLVAAMVGLLFGLHPMTVEPIPWVGERKTLLAAFFALWCLISYVWYTRRKNWLRYGICLAMYVLALMSKPTATPLPLLLLLMDYWPLRRLRWQAVLEKLPLLVVGGLSAIITYISQSRTLRVILPDVHSPGRIPLILCHNIIFYLHKIIWPVNLSSHYPFPEPLNLSHPTVLIGVVGTCILIATLVISFRWTPALLIGWLFFFIAILPTMQIIGFSDVIASDKFAYLPSVGLLLSLTWLLTRFWNNRRRLRQIQAGIGRVALVVIVIVLALLEGAATRRYLVQWQETEGFWRYMISMAPHAYGPHSGLAFALSQKGKFDEAIKEYHEVLRLKSNDPPTHLRMGVVLALKGDIDEAIVHFNTTLELNPGYAEAHRDLGTALLQKGQVKLAIKHLRESVRLKPKLDSGLNNLAWILATHKDPEVHNPVEAIQLAEQACKISHYRNAESLDTLAAAYAAAGQFDEAVKIAEQALGLSPENKVKADKIRSRLSLYRERKPYYESAQPTQ